MLFFATREIRRAFRCRIPIGCGIELLQLRAARIDAPKFAGVIWFFTGEHNCSPIGRENRIAVLSGIVIGQLSQQLSVFTMEIKVGMTWAFGLQVTDRHRDFGVAARNRRRQRKYYGNEKCSESRLRQHDTTYSFEGTFFFEMIRNLPVFSSNFAVNW